MPRPSRLTISKNDIFAYFDAAPQKVFTQAELAVVLDEQRSFWRLAVSTSTLEFIGFLIEHKRLHRVTFKSEAYNQEIVRYSWGNASIYKLALSLRKSAYLSHGTAVFLHGLTDLIPKTIYLNAEQSPKPPPRGELTQQALSRAFANKQRQSNLSYAFEDWEVTVVNGKHTDRLGVEALTDPTGEKVDATNLERTLIDITVRPAYAGGIFQVLQAYQTAKKDVSTNRLLSILKKLNYVYPYHQAIGFLMQRAGYAPDRYEMLREPGTNFDFYITHAMEDPVYDSTWRLFHPKGLEL
jgi:predicted transcriptional regulator of viral defense system